MFGEGDYFRISVSDLGKKGQGGKGGGVWEGSSGNFGDWEREWLICSGDERPSTTSGWVAVCGDECECKAVINCLA